MLIKCSILDLKKFLKLNRLIILLNNNIINLKYTLST